GYRRFTCDWSSHVCSSDLSHTHTHAHTHTHTHSLPSSTGVPAASQRLTDATPSSVMIFGYLKQRVCVCVCECVCVCVTEREGERERERETGLAYSVSELEWGCVARRGKFRTELGV